MKNQLPLLACLLLFAIFAIPTSAQERIIIKTGACYETVADVFDSPDLPPFQVGCSRCPVPFCPECSIDGTAIKVSIRGEAIKEVVLQPSKALYLSKSTISNGYIDDGGALRLKNYGQIKSLIAAKDLSFKPKFVIDKAYLKRKSGSNSQREINSTVKIEYYYKGKLLVSHDIGITFFRCGPTNTDPCSKLGDRIPFYVQSVDDAIGMDWMTRASIPLPKTKIKTEDLDKWIVTKEGSCTAIPSQFEEAGTWDDGSVKWLHVYFTANYREGKAPVYVLTEVIANGSPSKPPVVNEVKAYHDNLPLTQFTLPMPSNNLSVSNGLLEVRLVENSCNIRSINGSDSFKAFPFINNNGNLLNSNFDENTVELEQMGNLQAVIKIRGHYAGSDKFRYVLRLTVTANSPVVKVSLATIFCGDMTQSQNSIQDMGFRLSSAGGLEVNELHTSIEGQSALVTATKINDAIHLHQHRYDSLRYTNNGNWEEHEGKSAGWFRFNSNNPSNTVTVLAKHFWQKFPKEVAMEGSDISIYTWPKSNVQAFDEEEELRLDEIYKFWCFHQGDDINFSVPQIYIDTLGKAEELDDSNSDTSLEGQIEKLRQATGDGVAVFNEFALYFSGDNTDIASIAKLYQQDPIALPNQKWIADSKVFGNVSERIAGAFDEIEETIIDAPLAYTDPSLNNNYGMYNFGDSNNNYNFSKGRPYLHRVWSNNHYQQVYSMWQLVALRNENRFSTLSNETRFDNLLQRVRSMTDHCASIDMLRDSIMVPRPGGGWDTINVGAFRHTKGLVHWGNQEEAGLTKHWSDPSGIHMAWLIDANRWAKDGFVDWTKSMQKFGFILFTNLDNDDARNLSQHLFNLICLYNYNSSLKDKFEKTIGEAIVSSANTLLFESSSNGVFDTPKIPKIFHSIENGPRNMNSPLWAPLVLNKFYDWRANAPDKSEYDYGIVTNAKLRDSHINMQLGLASLAYGLTKDPSILKRHFYFLEYFPKNIYQNPRSDYHHFGMGTWALGDQHIPMQWPTFLKTLTGAGYDSIPATEEHGTYFKLGSQDILMYRPLTGKYPSKDSTGRLVMNIQQDLPNNGYGSLGNCSLYDYELYNSDGAKNEIYKKTILPSPFCPNCTQMLGDSIKWNNPEPFIKVRDKSYQRVTEKTLKMVDVFNANDGVTKLNKATQLQLYLEGSGFVYQPINQNELPEGQRLAQNNKYSVKHSKGYLLPLTTGNITMQISFPDTTNAVFNMTVKDSTGSPVSIDNGTIILDNMSFISPISGSNEVKSFTVTLTQDGAPYYIDFYTSFSSSGGIYKGLNEKGELDYKTVEPAIGVVFSNTVDKCLLFGENLNHLKIIKAKLF
jgi:YetA-like protein